MKRFLGMLGLTFLAGYPIGLAFAKINPLWVNIPGGGRIEFAFFLGIAFTSFLVSFTFDSFASWVRKIAA